MNRLVKPVLFQMFQSPLALKLRTRDRKNFAPKVPVYHETDRFIVKTAANRFELKKALKLRHKVFNREVIGRHSIFFLDIDKYDFDSDHLIILDKTNRKIIGTYRVRCSLFNEEFYSETEFNLRPLLSEEGVKIELGRACIHPNYRNGSTINLLWKGISEYIRMTDADILFGCSSIYTMDPVQMSAIAQRLRKQNRTEERFKIEPLVDYHPTRVGWRGVEDPRAEGVTPEIPTLILSYLKAGAKLVPIPAVDHAFKCVDFLTVLETENLSKRDSEAVSEVGQNT